MMRRSTLWGFAAAAAMIVAASPAAAQLDSARLFRPKPAPDNPAEEVPVTAKTAGVSPEAFARMNIPANAMAANRPSRQSDGFVLFERPVMLPGPARPAVALATDAVIASEAARVDPRRWLLKAPIAIGAPFDFTLPAGTTFAEVLDERGDRRLCLARKPYQTYTPPEEGGEIYPYLCAGTPNAAGQIGSVQLMPYYTDRTKPRDFAIAPATLAPVPAGTSQPNFGAVFAVRRLRVAEAGDRVTLVLEIAGAVQKENDGPVDPFALTRFDVVDRVDLPMRDRAHVSVGGVTVTLRKTPAGWTIEASGNFAPWAEASADGTQVQQGEMRYGPIVR